MGLSTSSSRSFPISDAEGNRLISDPEKAEKFREFYASHGGNAPAAPDPHGTDFDSLVRDAIANGNDSPLNSPISIAELNSALTNLRSKAFGSDFVSNVMIKNLSTANRKSWLYVLNQLLSSGFVPPSWKTAIVIPVLKPGKNAADVDSYRPIALTSCEAKAFEKIINARLQWHLDKINAIPKQQIGFRRNCSTSDHLIRLETAVKKGFNNSESTFGIFLDLTKAYDLTWVEALLFKLSRLKVSGSLLLWLKNFLSCRILRVRINSTLSSSSLLFIGLPQGGVLCPTLWIVMMYDFPLPSNPLIELFLFADDIAPLFLLPLPNLFSSPTPVK